MLKETEERVLDCEHVATAEEMFEKIVEVIKKNFVASYEKEGTTLVMRSVGGGVEFRITVEKSV